MLQKVKLFNYFTRFAAAHLRGLDPTGAWVFAASQILLAAPWIVAAAVIARGGAA